MCHTEIVGVDDQQSRGSSIPKLLLHRDAGLRSRLRLLRSERESKYKRYNEQNRTHG